MRACIHRGSKQIGGSCVELECGGKRLLIDFGLPLDAGKNSSRYLPNVKGLDGKDPSLLGVLISHSHFDHFGLLAHISDKIPVGMGPAARRIIEAATPFLPEGWAVPARGWDYQSGQIFNIGPFCVTPFLVDHSAYDAYALLVEGAGRRLFYSGDFRGHGRKAPLFERLIKNPPPNIDTLLLEGSSLGRLNDSGQFPTEADIEKKMRDVFAGTEGLVMVHTSGQNIDRIVSIFRACKKTGRKMIVDLYTAAILEATGNKKIPQSDWPEVLLYVPNPQRKQIWQNEWFPLLTRHSANRVYIEQLEGLASKATLLFRPLHCRDLEKANCLNGAVYIYSQWEGYWDEGSYDNVKDWLKKHSITKHAIHTSGHASPVDLKKMAAGISPRRLVPIHSFFADRYSELFSNVVQHNDDEWWNV